MKLSDIKVAQVTKTPVFWLEQGGLRQGEVFNVTREKMVKVKTDDGFTEVEPEKLQPELMTTGQVGEIFGVTSITVWRWLDRGLLSFEQGGQNEWRMVHAKDLQDALREGIVPPKPGRPKKSWVYELAERLKISKSYIRKLRQRRVFSDPPTEAEIVAFENRDRKWTSKEI